MPTEERRASAIRGQLIRLGWDPHRFTVQVLEGGHAEVTVDEKAFAFRLPAEEAPHISAFRFDARTRTSLGRYFPSVNPGFPELRILASYIQNGLSTLGHDPASFTIRVENTGYNLRITYDPGLGRAPFRVIYADHDTPAMSIVENLHELTRYNEILLTAGPPPRFDLPVVLDESQRLIARYQACAGRIWRLFAEDPLGDHPAHTYVERLEAILDLGLLVPKSEGKRALDRILDDEPVLGMERED